MNSGSSGIFRNCFMNSGVVFIVIVVLLCAEFVLERILEILNRRAMSQTLPESLKGIYDEKEYRRFRNYRCENNRFELLSSSLSFVVMLVFLCLGGFGWWNAIVVAGTDNTILQTLIFMLGLSLVSGILNMPF